MSQKKGSKKSNCYLIGMPGIEIAKYENVDLTKYHELLDIESDKTIIYSSFVIVWSKIEKQSLNTLQIHV